MNDDNMIVCNEPDREPDLVLPQNKDYAEVKIWAKEGVFSYNNRTWSTIKSSGVIYTDVTEYLEYVASCPYGQQLRAKIAMEYLAEIALLDDN